nr:orf174EGC125 [uncultured bacterium]
MSSVIVSPYSEEWPNIFRQVRQELLSVFVPITVSIEHIGSTSVPGLAAKSVIDVLLGAGSLPNVESKIEPLGRLGYNYVSKYEQELSMRRYFVKSPATSLRIHLHAVELGSRFWQEHLAFRDLLRSDTELRSNYQSLKLQLAHEHSHDKSAYSVAKGPFIQAALAATTRSGNAA